MAKRPLLLGFATLMLSVLIILCWYIKVNVRNPTTAFSYYHSALKLPINRCEYYSKALTSAFWKQVDYEQLPIPKEAMYDTVSIIAESHFIKVNGVNIHYKESKALKPASNALSVLFLHGAAFSSDTWESLGTINLVAAFGFRAVAVDLPGFGKSPRAAVSQKTEFLSNLIASLKLQKPVIVSPSMSGVFSVPYVIEYWRSISGYIPISPVVPTSVPTNCHGELLEDIMDKACKDLMKYERSSNEENFSCIKVPVMVIHGQHDQRQNSAQMCHFPWSKGVIIPDGQHAAYMTNPSLWHQLLYNFLNVVNKTQTCK